MSSLPTSLYKANPPLPCNLPHVHFSFASLRFWAARARLVVDLFIREFWLRQSNSKITQRIKYWRRMLPATAWPAKSKSRRYVHWPHRRKELGSSQWEEGPKTNIYKTQPDTPPIRRVPRKKYGAAAGQPGSTNACLRFRLMRVVVGSVRACARARSEGWWAS